MGGQCHQESSDQSFQWSCYEGAKKVAKATVSAPLAHQVHQKVYNSPDCSGDSSDSDFSGDKVCFKTGDGKSEDIQCDPDNAAMHVTKYSDELCTTYLNAFSIPSGQCHQESSDQSFKWSCYESVKKAAKATSPHLWHTRCTRKFTAAQTVPGTVRTPTSVGTRCASRLVMARVRISSATPTTPPCTSPSIAMSFAPPTSMPSRFRRASATRNRRTRASSGAATKA